MKYVFFDIECASVSKQFAKICAFGYVVTDEQFHILKQEDILLNPKGGFHLTDRKGERGLVLPYEYSAFKSCPTFDEVYPKIKELLEGEDTLVFGHAVMNDVKYLCLETERFHLPSFRFAFGDTQLIFMTRQNAYSNQPGLETVIENLGVEFTPHRAVDDAYATMKIAEALSKEVGTDLKGLISYYGVTLGKIENYHYTPATSKGEIAHKQEVERKKAERGERRNHFFHVVFHKRPKVKNGKLSGKYFLFARRMEEEEESIELLQYIFANGGKYVTSVKECNVFVCREGEGGERLKDATSRTDVLIVRPCEVEKI